MSSYDSYYARVTTNGTSVRERNKTTLIETLTKTAPDSLSCKDVLINDVAQKLVIDSGTKPYFKVIKSLPNETFSCGDYVDFADRKWLITNADNDTEIYTDGNMQECNYEIQWQNNALDVIKRSAVVMSASQYNSGEEGNKTVVIGYNQLLTYMPLDEDTTNFKQEQRVFIDNNTEKPKVYRATRIDTVSMTFNGVGCLVVLFTEDQYNPDTDRIDLMLCDYKTEIPQPITSIEITYNGNPQIRSGGTAKTFTAISDNPITLWEVIVANGYDSYITTTSDPSNSSKCKVKCLQNNLMIGSTFRLKCTDNVGNIGELLVNIAGGM